MASYKVEAIIIKAHNYKEADKILTLLTKEYGKISVLAKGVRKIKSKNRGSVQLFSQSQIMVHQGKFYDSITQCQLLNSFSILLTDLDKMTYAAYITELVNKLIPEREQNEKVYLLLLITLNLLQYLKSQLVIRCFEIKLLSILGYKPELKKCINCGSKLNTNIYFSPKAGGVLCSNCQLENEQAFIISGQARAVLDQLQSINMKFLNRLKISELCNNELEKILIGYITYQLENKLKSLDFLQHIKNVNNSL